MINGDVLNTLLGVQYTCFHVNYSIYCVCIEWRRVLIPGGLLMVAVPDIETIFRIFIRPSIPLKLRHTLLSMVFGGQVDAYYFHFVSVRNELSCVLTAD